MNTKRIVVALGHSALGKTFPEQKENVKKAANAIADLVEAKYEIVITHSNGPQIGMIHSAMTEYSRLRTFEYCCTYVDLQCNESGIHWLRLTKRDSYRTFKPRYL